MLSRPARLALAAAALAVGLAGCGTSSTPVGESDGPTGLDAVTVEGDVDAEPQVDFETPLNAPSSEEVETAVEGDGAALAEGDRVLVNYWLGNGFDGKVAQDSFGQEAAGVLVTVGQEAVEPTTVDSLVANTANRLVSAGTTIGSRLVATGTAQDLLGVPGIAEIGIGNLDPVVLVMDLVAAPLDAPEGRKVAPPSWVPGLKIEGEVPVAWTFDNTPPPSDRLRVYSRIVGTGPKVAEGDLLVANYLGQVYDGKQPFDESYSREPVGFGIGLGQVIKGWDQALVGLPVGSRVVLAIPPDLGYGAQGSPQAGITGEDTLYFVVDILGAA